jgi:hemerythrin
MFKVAQMGLKDIDSQHEQLVDCMVELLEGTKKTAGVDAVRQALKRLRDYAKTHFAYEEQLMLNIGYPKVASHQQLHQIFFKKLDEFESDVQGAQGLHATELLLFLKDWLIQHIAKEDRDYANHKIASGN